MSKVRFYFLVIEPGKTPRVAVRRPILSGTQVAYNLKIVEPEGWGKVGGTVEVVLPDAPSSVSAT